MDEHQLLSISRAAERYHGPIPMLRNALQQGYIKGHKIGKQRVAKPRDNEAYLENPPRLGRPPKRTNYNGVCKIHHYDTALRRYLDALAQGLMERALGTL